MDGWFGLRPTLASMMFALDASSSFKDFSDYAFELHVRESNTKDVECLALLQKKPAAHITMLQNLLTNAAMI